MLQPKKQKFRKEHRGRGALRGKSKGGNAVSFGSIGLKAIEGGEITSRQIEAARRTMTRHIKRGGSVSSPILLLPAKHLKFPWDPVKVVLSSTFQG
jgi:ribosomal protein L16